MVPSIPSIKGSVLAGHAEALHKFLAANPVDSAVLAERFPPGELEMLSRPIQAISWYDVRIYQRILEFLRDFDGYGSNAYLIATGERSAQRLLAAGFYPQFDYLNRTQLVSNSGVQERHRAFGRDLRLLTTLSQSILNFIVASVKEDPDDGDRWMIEYANASALPEVLCWTTQGFNNWMAAQHGTPDLWRWERTRPDLVWFRMTRPA